MKPSWDSVVRTHIFKGQLETGQTRQLAPAGDNEDIDKDFHYTSAKQKALLTLKKKKNLSFLRICVGGYGVSYPVCL